VNVKIKLIPYGQGAVLAHPFARPDADACPPIVEITGTDGMQPHVVIMAFCRAVIWPIHTRIPWMSIKDARQGQIVPRGSTQATAAATR